VKPILSIFASTFVLFSASVLAQDSLIAPKAREGASRTFATLVTAPDVSPRETHSFQVSLLIADTQNGSGFEGLSKNAQKALEDLQDFLPFKSYRLLDFAWLRTSSHSYAKVKGPDGQEYELTLGIGGVSPESDGKIYISRFDLRDGSAATTGSRSPLLGRALISTSFGIEEGETVVVGTSRLEGDHRALVVLLTAVPASLSGK